jgi:hypothetical protein
VLDSQDGHHSAGTKWEYISWQQIFVCCMEKQR